MAHIYRMTVPRGQKHSALFAAREHAFHQGKRVNRKPGFESVRLC